MDILRKGTIIHHRHHQLAMVGVAVVIEAIVFKIKFKQTRETV
jgi:hypothetical protein